ncbi:hypothetical protein KA405_01415 [Patescibacteria group bacterium]|nr:hypothetical protein [Patescibacteria group bacterium]
MHVQKKVFDAHQKQTERFVSYQYTTNAQINAKDIQTLIPLSDEAKDFLKQAIKSLHISPRLLHRIQRIARTIADLA